MENKTWRLNKNNIFLKLMKFTWNADYTYFKWMCVFTWLSVFNVLILPLTIIIKYVIIKGLYLSVLSPIADKIDNHLKESAWVWANNNYYRVEMYRDGDIIDLSFLRNASSLQRSAFFDRMSSLDWQLHNKIRDLLYRYNNSIHAEKYVKKMSVEERRLKRINKIGRIVKPISVAILWTLGASVIAFLAYLLIKGIIAMTLFTVAIWTVILWVTLIVSAVILLAFLLFLLFRYISAKTSVEENLKIAGGYTILPFVWVKNVFIGLFRLIKETISDSCPAIEWVDD